MGYTLRFRKGDETSPLIDFTYGYNIYRGVFDPMIHKDKSGAEMAIVLNCAITVLEAKHPIRHSSRDLLKASSGNLEILLRALLEDATAYSDWTFYVE